MKLLLAMIAVCTLVSFARAEEPGFSKIGIGFHEISNPLGVRWWVGRNTALDVGLGFSSDEYESYRLSRAMIRLGAPCVVSRFGRLAVEVRPSVGYGIEQQVVRFIPATGEVVKGNDHLIEPSLQLEAEVLVIDHLSVSGAFGFGATVRKSSTADETLTSWWTTAGNFAHFGLHLYLGDPL
jgi:hypothetical protein